MIVLGLLLITGCSSSNEPANELKAEAKTETAAAKTKQKQKSLPNVKILATGGTIAGADKSKTSTTNYRADGLLFESRHKKR